MKIMIEHETIVVSLERDIDRNIAPVVRWLSSFSGIHTSYSCEENGLNNGGYVLFVCTEFASLREICFLISGAFWHPLYGKVVVDLDEFKNFRYRIEFCSIENRNNFIRMIGETYGN